MAIPMPATGLSRADLAAYVRSVARAAAAALPGYVSILWKGSAYKPWESPYDFMPGLSDLDVHVYRPGGMGDAWALRDRVVGEAGPAPGGIPLQLMVLDTETLPEWWTVLPGTYGVMAGGPPPVAVPPLEVLLERDRIGLAEAAGNAARVDNGVVGRGDGELWDYLVATRWMYVPALYRVVALAVADPAAVWAMNRTALLAAARRLPSVRPVLVAGEAFLGTALAASERRPDGGAAGEALRAGQALLRAAGEWGAARDDAVVERRAPAWWREA